MKKGFLKNISAMESPPSMQPKKSSRKTLLAILAIVIIVVVVVVGVYFATMNNAGTDTTATPTPGPTGTSSPTATPAETGGNVAGASSLQYTVAVTDSSGASLGSYTYSAKNAGTNNLMLRIESTGVSGGDFIYIINGAQQKAWVETGGVWTDLSSTFQSTWDSWDQQFTGYVSTLGDWSGVGNYVYADPNGDTITITNIAVNPSLSDSLFVH